MGRYICNMRKSVNRHLPLLVLLFITNPSGCFSQADSSQHEHINVNRTAIVSGAFAGGSALSYAALQELWYNQYERTRLHSFNDNVEWLQMDKAGHAMTSYQLGIAGNEVLRWCGWKEKPAACIGGSVGTLYLTGLEILDGRSKAWGFSWGDEMANVAGSFFFISQQLLWSEQRMKLKFSFTPSVYSSCRPDVLGENFSQQILKDYNGQTYWLSANISSFTGVKNNFPKWINIAFGYGADGMISATASVESSYQCGTPPFIRSRQFLISLDADLVRIQTRSKFLRTFFKAISLVKLPFPVVEYSVEKGLLLHSFYF